MATQPPLPPEPQLHGAQQDPFDPRGQRPIQPVPVTYGATWAHFLIVLCLIVAWYFPLRIVVSHFLWPKADQGPRDAYSFVALAYEGISSRTNEVDQDRFKEHLDALRSHGYIPIGLEDVRRLLSDGKPVPRKAVLLTFDHGRKTTYFAVDSLLRRAGWKAVMFLWTRPIMEHDSAALLWPYVRIMSRSGIWEIGAQSHDGLSQVTASSSGLKGHFMTTPRWISDQHRFEKPGEFGARVAQDHEECLRTIEDKVGVTPDAYAYPYGDFGQFNSRALFSRQLNLGLVGKYYGLGFLTGNLAANTQYSDPRRLNRARVKPDWSGADLVTFLDRSWPVDASVGDAQSPRLASSAFIVDWGSMKQDTSGRMTLYAPENITGAKMWLAGSDLTRDFFGRVVFRDLVGQMGIYARAAADEESFVYLGVDSKGSIWLRQRNLGHDAGPVDEEEDREMSVWLRQKHVSLERFTLASTQARVEPGREHTLDLYMRGRLLYAMLDNNPLFKERIMLRGEMKPGMLGLSVWNPEKGRASVTVSKVILKKQEPTIAAWNAGGKYEPGIFEWIHRNAYRITEISPPWISFSPAGQLIKSNWDPTAYRMLAKIHQFRLLPRISISDDSSLSRLAPSQLVDKLSEIRSNGLFVKLSEMRNPPISKLTTWLQQCAATLRSRDMSLLVQLPASMEKPAMLQSMLAVIPGLQVVASSDSPLSNPTNEADRVATTQLDQVPEPEQDSSLPSFYELSPTALSTNEALVEVKSARLQQEGQAAFLDADYAKAIDIWKTWQALEPNNARIPSLIGDAYLRQGEFAQAISNYDASLDLDPGQVRLALRRAGLLDNMGKSEDAMNSLNMYARLFPENEEVMLAQAEWLRRHDRASEAIDLVKHALGVNSNSMEATAMLLRLPIPQDEFNRQMQNIVRQGSLPENNYELGQIIWKYDLLSLPGSHSLVRLVRKILGKTDDPRVTSIFERLKPRAEAVTDTFVTGNISDAWWMDGGNFDAESGQLHIRADDSHTEATMRLLGSEHFRDAYVEATVQRKAGSFWLYARRTADHVARFGFDETGQVYLQVWQNGQMVENKVKSLSSTNGPTRLRLEVRGDGLVGLVDGAPAFSAPMEVPPEFELGWVGFAAYSPDLGKAHVVLMRTSAGPLSPRIAVLPSITTSDAADAALASLRPEIFEITDLAPDWFSINSDGAWSTQVGPDEKLFRMFSRYYRIRLMPTVKVAAADMIDSDELIARAAEHRLDGYVLNVDAMPDEKWFDSMERSLGGTNLKILVAAFDPAQSKATVRSLAAGSDLIMSAEEAQDILVQPWLNADGSHTSLSDLPPGKPSLLKL